MSDVPPPVDVGPVDLEPGVIADQPEIPATMMPRSQFDIHQDLQYSSDLREKTDKAFAAGDHVNGYKYLDQQRTDARLSSLEVALEGGNPVAQTSPKAAFVHPMIETERRANMLARQESDVDDVISKRWPEVNSYWIQEVWERYFEQNEAPLEQFRADMSPEDLDKFQRRLRPVMVDPNVHANINSVIVEIDQALKAINPELSAYTHPRTKDIANWMLQEMEPGRTGFFEAAPQPYDYGAGIDLPFVPEWGEKLIGFGGQLGMSYIDTVYSPIYGVIEGMSALGMTAISNITGDEPTDYWSPPTNGIDKTTQMMGVLLQARTVDVSPELKERLAEISGKPGWLNNGGKVHPKVGHDLQARQMELDTYFERAAHEVGQIREWKQFQARGGEWLVNGIAQLAGAFTGFRLTAGKAWQIGGRSAMRGMTMLGLAKKGTPLRKVQEVLTRTTGATIAGGLFDGVAYGKGEGFGAAMAHGMVAVPLYTMIGAMGHRISKTLTKKQVPPAVANQVSAAAGGVGLGGLEIHELSPIWRFLQNGEEKDWAEFGGIILKNVITMMMMRKGTPADMVDQLGILGEFEASIKISARKAFETKDLAEREEILKASDEEGWSREAMMKIGQLESEAAAARGVDPKAAKAAREGTEQAVKDATREQEGVDEPTVARAEKRWQAEEEIERLREPEEKERRVDLERREQVEKTREERRAGARREAMKIVEPEEFGAGVERRT